MPSASIFLLQNQPGREQSAPAFGSCHMDARRNFLRIIAKNKSSFNAQNYIAHNLIVRYKIPNTNPKE
ncbi:conserved hypothetical protein [Agrobacterium fabrum str. J-07]|nr:conserved hypothetical protein [Agrobacterium fabrum str. J-07]